MKNVTEMANTKKSSNKAHILYVKQNQRNSINNKLNLMPIYPQL